MDDFKHLHDFDNIIVTRYDDFLDSIHDAYEKGYQIRVQIIKTRETDKIAKQGRNNYIKGVKNE